MKKSELIDQILKENPKMDPQQLEHLSYESLLLVRIQIQLRKEFPLPEENSNADENEK
jgi:hypothetical protein